MMQVWPGRGGAVMAARGVAVLVDGENLAAGVADEVLRRAEALGPLVSQRAYCGRANANGWDQDMRFQKVYLDSVSGKNSIDIRMVIDAMEIAHAGTVDSFLIASCDSDFAALAMHLRDKGHRVIGMGRSETGARFRLACSEFHEVLARVARPEPATTEAATPATAAPAPVKQTAVDAAIHKVIAAHGTAGRTISLGLLGSFLAKDHGVSRKTAGFKTWQAYFKAHETRYVVDGKGPALTVTIRHR